MQKSINNKIKAIQSGAENQAEFMKKLAELDENGQLTADMQEQVNGGASSSKIGPITVGPIIDLPLLGIWNPTFPDVSMIAFSKD